jgi:hypothetical protein
MSVYSKIIFIFVLLNIIIGYGIDSITIKSIPYILLIFYAFLSPGFYGRKFIAPIMFLVVSVCLISISLHGILAAKDLFIALGGLLCTQYYVSKYKFNPQVVFVIYLLIFIPQFFYEYVVHDGYNLRYFPDTTSWNLNVIASKATKHGTSALGFLLLSTSVFYLFARNKSKIYLIFFLLSLYFIIFSGSRGGLIALFSAGAIYYVNKNEIRRLTTILLLILSIAFVYSVENYQYFFSSVDNTIISEYLKTDSFEEGSVSAGRNWLWNYHIQEFVESNYLGGGREAVDFFVGDYVGGEIAKAGSESPFTGLLACYGIIGILMIGLYLGMFIYALNRKNIYGVFITTIALMQTVATGSNYFSFMSYDSVLFFHLYFFSFNKPHLQYHATNKGI